MFFFFERESEDSGDMLACWLARPELKRRLVRRPVGVGEEWRSSEEPSSTPMRMSPHTSYCPKTRSGPKSLFSWELHLGPLGAGNQQSRTVR